MHLKILATAAALLLLAGCGTHSDAPDPATGNVVDGRNAHVVREPDGFRNVSFSCFGPDGIYVTSDSTNKNLPSGVAVVPNDPNCK
jgi:hypothetical protein